MAENGAQVPLQYRYRVAPDQKVNAFKPKDLSASDDKLQLRGAMFGAVFAGSFNTLPTSEHSRVVWEACLVTPTFLKSSSSMTPHFKTQEFTVS